MTRTCFLQRTLYGFSLIETILTVSIMTLCVSIGFAESLSTLSHTYARADRLVLLASIREARAESIHHTCRSLTCAGSASHGIYVEHNHITLFEGSSYIKRNATVDLSIPFLSDELVSTVNQVVFTYSGNSTSSTTISITGKDNRTETIQIAIHGGILAHT